MRVSSPIPHHKARIEIIPLIDIMFFLLASFMMVSLSQVHMKGIKVTLPTGASGETQSKRDYISVSVDVNGDIGESSSGEPGRQGVRPRGSRYRAREYHSRARHLALAGFLQNRI
jgi:Biopolymer transport protein ExbD/TolR